MIYFQVKFDRQTLHMFKLDFLWYIQFFVPQDNNLLCSLMQSKEKLIYSNLYVLIQLCKASSDDSIAKISYVWIVSQMYHVSNTHVVLRRLSKNVNKIINLYKMLCLSENKCHVNEWAIFYCLLNKTM